MAYEKIEEIAKRLALSPSTISRVINGKNNVSEKTRDKVLEALKESKYVPNLIARSLKTTTKFIGAIFPDMKNPYFIEVISGIERVLKNRGYTVLYLNTNNSIEEEEKSIIELLSVRVQGIILLSSLSVKGSKVIELAKENTYLTSVENCIEGVDSICIDNQVGTRQAIEYLLSMGHKKIGYCSKTLSYNSWNARYEAYRKILEENGIPVVSDYIYIGENFTELLDKNNLPSAIYANTDLNAVEIYEWCQKNNIKIGEELSIIGFDNINFSKILTPKLTTIAQPAYSIGETVAENLLLRIERKSKENIKQILIEPNLKIRDSVKKINSVIK